MSIKGSLGETLRTSITHIDSSNNPIIGASFSVVVANRPDDSVFPVTFREIGNGMYEASVATTVNDVPGEWFLLVQANNGYLYEETFDIIGQRKQVVPVPATPQDGASRLQLRRAIANQLGDLVAVTATVNGTESILTDTVNLSREMNAFNGMQVHCVDAQQPDNIGHVATVASNNPSTRSINFNPALPYPIMEGDLFDLYNFRDNGWRIDEYNQAINDAILRGGEEHSTIPYTLTVAEPFNRNQNLVHIPRPFSYFAGIDIVGKDGSMQKIPPNMYRVDKYTSEVSLLHGYVQKAHGKTIRLRGWRTPDLLHTDDAKTHLPTEWVVSEAIAVLLHADLAHGVNQGARDRLLNMDRGGADGRRPTIIATYGPNTVKLARG